VLFTFAREATDALAHPAFRAPSFIKGDGLNVLARPRHKTTGPLTRALIFRNNRNTGTAAAFIC